MVILRSIVFEVIEATSRDDAGRKYVTGKIESAFEIVSNSAEISGQISNYPEELQAKIYQVKMDIEEYLKKSITL